MPLEFFLKILSTVLADVKQRRKKGTELCTNGTPQEKLAFKAQLFVKVTLESVDTKLKLAGCSKQLFSQYVDNAPAKIETVPSKNGGIFML